MLLALLLVAATPAAVAVQGQAIVLTAPGAVPRTIVSGAQWSDPALSPDGRHVAVIRKDDDAGEHGHSSLWIVPTAGGAPRRLLASRDHDSPERNLTLINNPHCSPDGRYLYVDAPAWVTSAAVHRVDVATGAERYLVAGDTHGVVQTGKWRGHLLVSQHRYRRGGGSYEVVMLVRPDGRPLFPIPGSIADDGERSVPRWLKANGATLG